MPEGTQDALDSTLTPDAVVIGWGKAGKTLAGSLAKAGQQVVMVERSPQMYGGTCINIACVPTKDLVHSAQERRPDHDDPQQWFRQSVESRDALVSKLNAVNYSKLDSAANVTIIDGEARFTGDHTLEVTRGGDRLTITAPTIIINTGATNRAPHAIEGAVDSAFTHDSTSIQHVEPLPRRLVIVGSGPVGLEFASMFAQYGSEVTLVDRGERLLPEEDADVAEVVAGIIDDLGVRVLHGTEAVRMEDHDGFATVHLDSGDTLEAEAVMFAIGRVPATEGLGLDRAGIASDERGFVTVDSRLRTNVAGIFAVGDVNGGPQQTYISYDDHRIVADQVLPGGTGTRSRDDRVAVPTTTFITPPYATVGMTEQEAVAAGHRVEVASKAVASIAAMPKPKIEGETHGLMKFVIDADTDEVLGARLVSIDAQEMINLVSLAMRTGTTASQLRDAIYIHPSSTEAFNEVLSERTASELSA